MLDLPPMPTWDGLHPLIIHFPIALLMVAPLLVILGAIFRKRGGPALMLAALLLMVLGTCSTYVAVSTGEAAGELADRTPAINAVLEHHEELAEQTRLVFTVLTVLFAGFIGLELLPERRLGTFTYGAVLAVLLVLYSGGALLLANAAHNGGRLVHELGVRSLMAPEPLPGAPGMHDGGQPELEHEEDGDD
jgi:uncharacterized membrane protein